MSHFALLLKKTAPPPKNKTAHVQLGISNKVKK